MQTAHPQHGVRTRRPAALALAALAAALLACGEGGGERAGVPTGKPDPARSGDGRLTPVAPAAAGARPTAAVGDRTTRRSEVSYAEAETAYHDRRYDEAVELFRAYAERRPENAWGHYMLGLAAWKAGDRESSIAGFERALAVDSGHVKTLVNLSRVLLEAGRAEEALPRIERALELEPGSGDAWRVAGNAFSDVGHVEEASEAYRRAILIDDRDAWSMNNLGLLRIREGRFEEALGPLARAGELRPEVGFFHNNLGVALERTGHSVAAVEAYHAALETEDGSEKASVSLERVTARGLDSDTTTVDLSELAAAFVEELEGWRASVLASEGEPGDDGVPALPEVSAAAPPDGE